MFTCTTCTNHFKTKSSLENHVTLFHGKKKHSYPYFDKKKGRKDRGIHINPNRCDKFVKPITGKVHQRSGLSKKHQSIKGTDLLPCFVMLERLKGIEKVATKGSHTCIKKDQNEKAKVASTLPDIEIISIKSENDPKHLEIIQPKHKITDREEVLRSLNKTSELEIQKAECRGPGQVPKKQTDYQLTQRQSGRNFEKHVPKSFYHHALHLVNQMQPSTPMVIQSRREENVDHAVLDLLQQKASNSKDEDRMFLLSILSDFKRVAPQKKVRVKKKIVEAIAEAFD